MIKFEELKNIRDFSELTIDEYATASIDDISQMLFAEAIRDSRKVVVRQGFVNFYHQNAVIKIKETFFDYSPHLQQRQTMNLLSIIYMHHQQIEMRGLVKNV